MNEFDRLYHEREGYRQRIIAAVGRLVDIGALNTAVAQLLAKRTARYTLYAEETEFLARLAEVVEAIQPIMLPAPSNATEASHAEAGHAKAEHSSADPGYQADPAADLERFS